MTLGIIGFGRIGSAVAERMRPFGLRLLVSDPYVAEEVITAAGAEPVAFAELLAESDIVTLHCPLTPETRALIDAEALARMKPSSLLVNTARGPIVDLDALTAVLAAGRLAGAALDVVYPEPTPIDAPLYQLPNVIVTPHAAYYSERSYEINRRETFVEVLTALSGRIPRFVANPGVLSQLAGTVSPKGSRPD
jgi:phosphoglycerate dehydrogenase-like enzyme